MKQARKIIRLLSASTFIIPKDRQFLSVLDKVLKTAEKHQQSFENGIIGTDFTDSFA
jgi:hypothetical protein